MFGYVNVYKNELKLKDYNLFKAYYCGLCKALGSRHNQFVRLGLSYDMTFLAIVADALSDSCVTLDNKGCAKHIGKHMVCVNNDAIDYSADVSIILTYQKLSDDVNDDRSIRARIAKLPYVRAYQKVKSRYPELVASIERNLELLADAEKHKCCSIDMVADPFAQITGDIFAGYDESLSELGYNIGRYIYITDAYSDIDKDRKKGGYNPYLCAYDDRFLETENFRNLVKGSLNMTLSAISESYEKLVLHKNKAILDNIVYMGLRSVFDQTFKTTEDKNERSV